MRASAMPCLKTALVFLFVTNALASSCTPRRICGDAGISYRDCVTKGCCWDGTIGVSGPRCFRKRSDKEACTAPKNLNPCSTGSVYNACVIGCVGPDEQKRKIECEAAFGKFPCNAMTVSEEESLKTTGEWIAAEEVHRNVIQFGEEPGDGFGEVVMEVEEGRRYHLKPNVPHTTTQTTEEIGTITETKSLGSTISAPSYTTVVEVVGKEAFESLPEDKGDVRVVASEEHVEGMEEIETEEIWLEDSESESQETTSTERQKTVHGTSEVQRQTPKAVIHYVFEHGQYHTPAAVSSTSEDTDEEQSIDEEFATESQTAVDSAAESQTAVDSAIESQTAVDSALESQTALDTEFAVDSQTAVDSAVDSQTAVDSAMDSQTAVDSAVDSQTAVDSAVESQTDLEEEDVFGSAESPEQSQPTRTQSVKALEAPQLRIRSAKLADEAPQIKFDIERHAGHIASLFQPCILAREASLHRKMSPAVREKDIDDLEEPWIAEFTAFGSVGAPASMEAFEFEIETAAASEVIPEPFDEDIDASKAPQTPPSEIAVPETSAHTFVEPEGVIQALQRRNPDAEQQAEFKDSQTQAESESEATHAITVEDSETTETEQPLIEGSLAEKVESMESEEEDPTVEVFGYIHDYSQPSDIKHNTTEHSESLRTTQPIKTTQILTEVANSMPLAGDLLSTLFTKPTTDLTNTDTKIAPANQAKTKLKSREAKRQSLTGSSTHCMVYRRIPCGQSTLKHGFRLRQRLFREWDHV